MDEITLIEMPRKFSFPRIKAYDGTTDPNGHVAQYKQRILAVALPKGSHEATMCKDGTILPSGEPSEVVQVLQGGLIRTISQLFHFGERLSIESSLVSKEELDDLKRLVSEEKA
ncbi:hypothetical protein F2Q69_00013407 [Brassica cretica]|uniref:Uncharacterized protein n=1 Tax=Brassica cretica TaxID=69181 RepID=A0A8S9R5R5_BRACR|nr:hypothetical protein F2Q69_00013407 [Brassica cretica]